MLIITPHAIDRARERVRMFGFLSREETETLLMKSVPVAKKINVGSGLYSELESVYNKGNGYKKEYYPIVYRMDSLGIYVTEFMENFNISLRSVQDLSFKRRLKIKLIDKEENFAKLIELREALREGRRVNKEIEDLFA